MSPFLQFAGSFVVPIASYLNFLNIAPFLEAFSIPSSRSRHLKE